MLLSSRLGRRRRWPFHDVGGQSLTFDGRGRPREQWMDYSSGNWRELEAVGPLEGELERALKSQLVGEREGKAVGEFDGELEGAIKS